jgi:hypothetical protein
MQRELIRHPDFPCAAVARIAVDVARAGASLRIDYHVTGAIDALALPAVSTPERTDELWKHTCFEAFLRPAPGTAYLEFNLAPSTCWAAYRFDDTRQGMRNVDMPSPVIEIERGADSLVLRATLAAPDGALGLGLSAVIEERSGAKSYWALAHPAGKPDFHHCDCFALELPAACAR